MATLLLQIPGAPPQAFSLVKPITSVGAASDSDVRLADVRGVVAIQFDGVDFTATALEGAALSINGKKRDTVRLTDQDVLALGKHRLVFKVDERIPQPGEAAKVGSKEAPGDAAALAIAVLARLQDLLKSESGSMQALALLLDGAIEVVKADRGFLLVVEEGVARVEVARNVQKQDIANAVERMSDSIVAKVLATREPVIVSDALHDAEFNASASVINLKLSSVMCLPLIRGGTLFGVVYLGNDKMANLFTGRELDLVRGLCGAATLALEIALERDELRATKTRLLQQLEQQAFGDIVGACDSMREVFRKVDKVAATDIGILVTGETGTGKELIAHELHRRGPRRTGPFVAINCGAIPEALLESELFGHMKGAFTGAVANRPGRFQAANGGTLFLDEIGDMPMLLQVKLLRALQDRAVVKVGDTKPEAVDIRVVAATNKDLEVELKAGRFREDLYYRLNVVHLHLPPLRERGEDMVMLAKWFLGRATRELSSKVKGFSAQALVAIQRYRWPGNIRQLENRIKKAVVLTDKPLIGPDDLELRPESLDPILPLSAAQEEWRKRYISEVLERNGGNRTKTAKDLGVDPRTVFRHLERMEAEKRGEVPPPEDLGPAEGES